MSSAEIVVRAGHTKAESAKLWVRLVASGEPEFITAWIGVIQNHSCSHFWICLLFVIATVSILS